MQAIDWKKIIDKHGPIVWRTAYRLLGNHTDVSDCFEETFICALEISRRHRVRNFPGLLAWLATSRAIDRLKLHFSRSKFNGDVVVLSGQTPGPFQPTQEYELAAKLRKALTKLQPKEAEALCLRYFNNMSYRQISKELGIKANTARVLLNRARTKLHNLLKLPPK